MARVYSLVTTLGSRFLLLMCCHALKAVHMGLPINNIGRCSSIICRALKAVHMGLAVVDLHHRSPRAVRIRQQSSGPQQTLGCNGFQQKLRPSCHTRRLINLGDKVLDCLSSLLQISSRVTTKLAHHIQDLNDVTFHVLTVQAVQGLGKVVVSP